MFVTLAVLCKDRFIEAPIRSIVHSEHNGHHGRTVGKDVALQAQIDRPAASAVDGVTTPSGVHKRELHPRKARYGVCFDKGRVEPLIGDAVAVKDHAITVSEIKTGWLGCRTL